MTRLPLPCLVSLCGTEIEREHSPADTAAERCVPHLMTEENRIARLRYDGKAWYVLRIQPEMVHVRVRQELLTAFGISSVPLPHLQQLGTNTGVARSRSRDIYMKRPKLFMIGAPVRSGNHTQTAGFLVHGIQIERDLDTGHVMLSTRSVESVGIIPALRDVGIPTHIRVPLRVAHVVVAVVAFSHEIARPE